MKILVATDLSDTGFLGVDALCSMQAPAGTEITLLHVIDLDPYTAGGSIPGLIDFANERLAAESARLASCGMTATPRVEQGDAARTISHIAAEENADLIVMTSLGKGARVGRLFGSTAEKVASAGHIPVLVERVTLEDDDSCCRVNAGGPFERTLAAVALDESASAVLAFTDRLPGLVAARVVHAVPNADSRGEASERLQSLVAGAPDRPRTEADVLIGEPAKVVVEASAEWNATAIALSPCAHGALHRAMWGSTARAIALHAPCSVLFVPQTAAS